MPSAVILPFPMPRSNASPTPSRNASCVGGVEGMGEGIRRLTETEEDLERCLQLLADMPDAQYERARKEQARKLGMRLPVLDKEVRRRQHGQSIDRLPGRPLQWANINPWPYEVNGAQLVEELVEIIREHIALPEAAARVMALWTIHTHAFAAASVAPRLA